MMVPFSQFHLVPFSDTCTNEDGEQDVSTANNIPAHPLAELNQRIFNSSNGSSV